MSDKRRRIARVTLAIEVDLKTDPGIDTPEAHEPPYDYLVVREVEILTAQTYGDARALQLVEQAGFEDHDPDDLIRDELTSALRTASMTTVETVQ